MLSAHSARHPGSKQPPVKRGALFYPGRVKQSKHESADVSFCDPVQSAGVSKQTIKLYYFFIVLRKPRLVGGAFSVPAGKQEEQSRT